MKRLNYFTVAITLAFVFPICYNSVVYAQVGGDGETPAVETVCDGLADELFGLCNAYCEAKDCDSDNPKGAKSCDTLLSNYMRASGGGVPPCANTCGDGFLDPGEEVDPPVSPFFSIAVDTNSCRWDFSGVRQLYCNGTCTWAGASDCDQADADILCKLKMDNPLSTAISWTATTALPEPGFPCSNGGFGVPVGDMSSRGVTPGFPVTYQDISILGSHGAGNIIADPICTNP